MTESDRPAIRPQYAAWALAILTATNLLNYLERNAIFAVFEPLKRDLALTDAQLGWLGSACVLVFSVAALPLGLLASRSGPPGRSCGTAPGCSRSRRNQPADGVAE